MHGGGGLLMLCLCYAYAEGYFFNGNGTDHESDDSRWNTKSIKYIGVHNEYAWGGGIFRLAFAFLLCQCKGAVLIRCVYRIGARGLGEKKKIHKKLRCKYSGGVRGCRL